MKISSLLGNKAMNDHINLRCPFCKHDFSHVRGAYTRLGSDESEADVYDGTEVKGTTPERRSALVVVIDGECHHSWNLVLQQSKGLTLVSVEKVKYQKPKH